MRGLPGILDTFCKKFLEFFLKCCIGILVSHFGEFEKRWNVAVVGSLPLGYEKNGNFIYLAKDRLKLTLFHFFYHNKLASTSTPAFEYFININRRSDFNRHCYFFH